MTLRLSISSISSNISSIFVNLLPMLIAFFFRKTSAIAVATLPGSDSTSVDCVKLIHMMNDFSSLSSGTQSPWGSSQHHNHQFQTHNSHQSLSHVYLSFQYSTNKNNQLLDQWPPWIVSLRLSNIQNWTCEANHQNTCHNTSNCSCTPKHPVHSNIIKSAHPAVNFECYCTWLMQVSRVPWLPTISYLTSNSITDFISTHLLSFPPCLFWFQVCRVNKGVPMREGGTCGRGLEDSEAEAVVCCCLADSTDSLFSFVMFCNPITSSLLTFHMTELF